MFCRKNPNLPRTAVSALFHAFPQIIWHGNRHSRGLQGTFARAMASISVHRATRTPPGIAPRHIRSRGDLQEEPQLGIHGHQSSQIPVSVRFEPYSTLSRKSSGTAIAFLGVCRAYLLARWHRFVSIEHSKPLQASPQGTFARAVICRKTPNLPRTAVSALFHAFLQII